ncbi:hypothetical protein Ocin01_02565 [Orchesella cincta]|uniref:Uncharacterized protein n=1 Tax=Orchesella cincta TaxID=48709 RepID=A0A1D2NFU0_ORCCI|nr:hypothetical protein Ocin01_02565 [Orchesella cincta]
MGKILEKAIFLIGLISFVSLLPYALGKKDKAPVKKCDEPKIFAENLNYDWIMAQSAWYFPLLSKEDLIRQSSDILKQKLDEVKTQDLTNACFQATWEGLTPIITGFGGKKVSYDLSPLDFTNFNILGYEKAWKKGQGGVLYITQTDNKNYVFFVRCWKDGERSWNVMTTSKKPSEEVKSKILQHAKHLGFAVEGDDLETIDYEGCAQTKTEL